MYYIAADRQTFLGLYFPEAKTGCNMNWGSDCQVHLLVGDVTKSWIFLIMKGFEVDDDDDVLFIVCILK